jgi:hypothetical protein
MAFLTTFTEELAWTGVFAALWVAMRLRVLKSGPMRNAASILHLHTCAQVAVSLYLLTVTLLSLAPTARSSTGSYGKVLQAIRKDDAFLPRYSYHLSKFYEYLDIILFVADGGKVDLHFGFHHLTTPYLTFFRILTGYEGWQLFAALNAAHHVLMYAFFAGLTATHPLLPYTRYIQLIVGLLWEGWIVWHKGSGRSVQPNVVAILLLTCYLIFLAREIRLRRAKKDA